MAFPIPEEAPVIKTTLGIHKIFKQISKKKTKETKLKEKFKSSGQKMASYLHHTATT